MRGIELRLRWKGWRAKLAFSLSEKWKPSVKLVLRFN